MHIPKHYFQDRTVLLLTGINAFLTFAITVSILLRLDLSRATGYIIQYRSQLGLSGYKSGAAGAIRNFIIFAIIILVFHSVLSIRVYSLRRHFSIAILAMGLLLLVLTFLVSNALLVL